MAGTVLRGMFAGVGHAPVFASLLIVPAAFIVTTAGMQTVWPSIKPAETRLAEQGRSAAEEAKTAAIPAPVLPDVRKASVSAPVSEASGSGVKEAVYNPPAERVISERRASDLNVPQIMTADAFNKSVAKSQIYVSSLADFDQATGTQTTGTPEDLAALDQKFQQTYADAIAAGGKRHCGRGRWPGCGPALRLHSGLNAADENNRHEPADKDGAATTHAGWRPA